MVLAILLYLDFTAVPTINGKNIRLPESIEFDHLETLGLLLVNILTEQIEGKITIRREQGTQYKITFKEQKYKERL